MRMESAVAGQPPLISLVVPVYNAGAWLDEAMASMRRQSVEAFEVLLVDDGSTDDSAQKCSRVCAEDARFRLLRQKNAAPAAARLTGIRAASGQYFAFMDADDRLAPEHLARLAAGAKAGHALCCTGWQSFADRPPEAVPKAEAPGWLAAVEQAVFPPPDRGSEMAGGGTPQRGSLGQLAAVCGGGRAVF